MRMLSKNDSTISLDWLIDIAIQMQKARVILQCSILYIQLLSSFLAIWPIMKHDHYYLFVPISVSAPRYSGYEYGLCRND